MTRQNNDDSVGQAVALILLGVAGGLGLDLCAKQLLQSYSLNQFIFLRSVIGVVMFLLLSRQFGGLRSLKTTRWKWHLLRTLLACGAMWGFFYGLSKMPLVNALTLAFTAPLIVAALSVPTLGERVGWRRWTAVIIGFCGVLLILRPGAGLFNLASISVLIAAFCYACLALTARHLGRTESSFSLSVYVTAGPMISAGAFANEGWQMPDTVGWVLFLTAGACSVVAWIGIIGGYRKASPSLIAPLEYTALVAGAIAGYLLWDEIPDKWVMGGAAIIISTGLYIVYREIWLERGKVERVPETPPGLGP
jgi:drug/metabolite transporter (DMT)-like permease